MDKPEKRLQQTYAQTYDGMCKLAAQHIADAIRRKQTQLPDEKFVLGLATGSTPIGIYEELVRMNRDEGLSFHNVVTFNLDEYIVQPRDHPDFYNKDISYHGFMEKHLFSQIKEGAPGVKIGTGIDPRNIDIPNGMAHDIPEECARYEAAIKAPGGIDLQLLGIGENGHLGFCEPGKSEVGSKTSEVALDPHTVEVNKKKFGFAADKAISMGLGTIAGAKELLLVANGPSKNPIMRRTTGTSHLPSDDDIKSNPALLLLRHPNASIIADYAARTQRIDLAGPMARR